MLAEEFEDELTCPVCLMLFTDPRTLPCGNSHNVCLECARGLWRNQPNGSGLAITCPVCRASCRMESGVDRLPLNLALKNMVEKLEAAQKGKPSTKKKAVRRRFKCDVCEKKPAVMECVTCVVKYCEACLETCHPKDRAVFKAHVVVPMEPVSGRECEVHEGQALAFFCTQCGVPVCAHCLLMGSHIEHPRVSLHSAVTEKKENFQTAVDALRSKHAAVLDFTQKADAATQNMEQTCRQLRMQVETECGELQMRVSAVQQKLLQVIDSQEREKRAVLLGQVEGQRQRLSVCGALLDRAEQVLANEDGTIFLDVDTHKLEKQLQGAADASLAPPQLAIAAPQLTLHMAQLRDAVSNMHFTEYLVPDPPTNMTVAEHTKDSLLITWNCEIKRDETITFIVQQVDFKEIGYDERWVEIYKGTGRSCTASGLSEQESYRFRVCGINKSGKGGWSQTQVFTTGLPRAPTKIKMFDRSHSSICLTWQAEPSARSRHATYIVEVSSAEKDKGGNADQDEWQQVYKGTSRVCLVTDLLPEQTYNFRACAQNHVGRGAWSATASYATTERMEGDSVDEKEAEDDDPAAGQWKTEQEEGNDESLGDDMAEQSMNAPTEEGDDAAVGNLASAGDEELVPQ